MSDGAQTVDTEDDNNKEQSVDTDAEQSQETQDSEQTKSEDKKDE